MTDGAVWQFHVPDKPERTLNKADHGLAHVAGSQIMQYVYRYIPNIGNGN